MVDSTEDFPYKAYVFTNRSTTASCFSARVITTPWPYGGNGASIYLAAYLGSFDPNDIQANVLADNNAVYVNVMHFKVPAQSDFVLVLSARPGAPPLKEPTLPPMDRGYNLYVGGCDPPAPGSVEDDASSPISPPANASAGEPGESGEGNSASLPEALTEGDEASPTSTPAKAASGDGTDALGDSSASCSASPHDATSPMDRSTTQ